MGKKIKLKIYTLGCKVNQYDSGWLSAQLAGYGFELAKNGADVAIVNTCAVTKNAIRKSRQIISKARKENPQAKIIVIGCWPKTYKLTTSELGVDLVVNSRELNVIIDEVKKIFNKRESEIVLGHSVLVANDKARYFIKIQDGCEQFCAYCIIPFARGKIKSRLADEIIDEIKAAIERGFKEFVLTGIHLGLYGKDLGDINLVGLLQKIVELPNLGRVRLSSIELNEVNDDLINLIANNDKLCKHLHIPLQSGCDKILKLMNRPYDIKFFRVRVEKIKKAMPGIALTTDVIIGFPGETEEDFNIMYNFIKEINFSRLHVFPFSAHEKTKAYLMLGKVDSKEKERRAEELRELSRGLEKKYRRGFDGKIADVLVERIVEGKYRGKTEHYFDIEFSEDQLSDKKDAVKLELKNIVKVLI